MKAIILDADGMLVDGERFSERLAREHGISTETTGPFFRNEFQHCLVGAADLRGALEGRVGEWGWQGSVDDLLAYWFAEKHNRIDRRFAPIIRALRANGVKAYLATNNEKYRTDDLVNRRRLGEWFDAVFSSGAIGHKKPEAAFFERILAETGLDKGDVTFWDDDPENVAGAEAFGLRAKLYTDFSDFAGNYAHEPG